MKIVMRLGISWERSVLLLSNLARVNDSVFVSIKANRRYGTTVSQRQTHCVTPAQSIEQPSASSRDG